jgi:hypothetical protein
MRCVNPIERAGSHARSPRKGLPWKFTIRRRVYSRAAGLRLTPRTNVEQCSCYVPDIWEETMLKTFIEEAAALTSIVLFLGMIAVWAQVIPQL